MIIWVGEEDHLRIMQMRRDTRISILLQYLQHTLHMIDAACEYPANNWLQRPAELPLRGFDKD